MDGEEIINAIREGLEAVDHSADGLEYCGQVSGGIVNQAASYKTRSRKYFVKWNTKLCTQNMFETERESLKLLRRLNIFRVPETYSVCRDHTGTGALHILEFIEGLQPLEKWPEFGTQVAEMHSLNSRALQAAKNQGSFILSGSQDLEAVEKFGFHSPTFLGNFSPGVVWRDTWTNYFIGDILNGLFTLAESKYGNKEIREAWSELQRSVDKVFKNENIQPELLHGDFCPVNFGQADDKTVLFDPSCLYGDPEFELIISETESPLHPDFFTAYRKLKPKSSGYANKMAVYRLFYYLIMWCHVDDEEHKTKTIESINDVRAVLKLLNK